MITSIVVGEEVARAFWARVDRSSADGCWPWRGGSVDEHGRGRCRVDGKRTNAPRAALILGKSSPPADGKIYLACHTCDNPSCCRPDHLFWGTQEENMRDMGRKGRAGRQLHPEKYARPRRPGAKFKPIKQPNAPKGIDPRTWTRFSTEAERALAARALDELESQRNRIGLVPAPVQHFPSHKIRVIESRNPDWYIEFGSSYWKTPRQFQLKRARVERSLQRVISGKVRGNGYEKEILLFLSVFWPEMGS